MAAKRLGVAKRGKSLVDPFYGADVQCELWRVRHPPGWYPYGYHHHVHMYVLGP